MRCFLITVLVLGLFFRFVNLDRKVYWYDETFTSLRASGYMEADVVQHFANQFITTVAELQQYQRPDFKRGVGNTIRSLAVEDTQHPPLYYGLAALWMRWIGSSVAAVRLLPAILSVLALPGTYWLCRELFVKTGVFKSSLPAWIGAGLIAISPLQVLYAQESREYSLWSAIILLSTAALLRAMRLNTTLSWGIYALTLAMGLYTFPFSGLMAIAHGLYVICISNFRFSTVLRAYLSASLVGVIAFLPWVWVITTNLSQAQTITNWTAIHKPLLELAKDWGSILGRLFFDGQVIGVDKWVHVALLLVIGYAFYSICRQTPKAVWLLVVLLAGVPALALMLPDVVLGGMRSTVPRYLIPALMGVHLAVTYLLTATLVNFGLHPRLQRGWQLITIAVFSAGILSCAISAQASAWWNKGHNQPNPEVAQIINHAINPLLVSDAETGDLLSLSYLLNPDVPILIDPHCYTCHINSPTDATPFLPQIPSGFRDIFLFHPRPSDEWLQALVQTQVYKLEAIASKSGEVMLWRIRKFF
jgi:uncharacterized membrane protein